jgi:hypothetical protein
MALAVARSFDRVEAAALTPRRISFNAIEQAQLEELEQLVGSVIYELVDLVSDGALVADALLDQARALREMVSEAERADEHLLVVRAAQAFADLVQRDLFVTTMDTPASLTCAEAFAGLRARAARVSRIARTLIVFVTGA